MTSGFPTAGHCQSPILCKGETGDGKGLGMEQLGKAIMDMMQKLMQGKPGGDSPPPPPPPPTDPTKDAKGCTTTYQVTTPSTDPCAMYVPPVSDQINGGSTGTALSDLLNSMQGGDLTGTNTNVSDSINQVIGGTTVVATTTNTTSVLPTAVFNAQTQGGLMPIGATGDIVLTSSGATVVVGTRDENTNSAVAGFLGGEAAATVQPKGVAANLCQVRPWSTNFLSFIIPPSFFDSLCTWRGYPLGIPVATVATSVSTKPKVTVTQTVQKPIQKPATTTPAIPGKVRIWAVPAAVPLGSRTSIFWNTQGVSQCTVSSPDGSFNQTTLSGGASTVALTGATTFTISCLDGAGEPVTGYVTVKLSI